MYHRFSQFSNAPTSPNPVFACSPMTFGGKETNKNFLHALLHSHHGPDSQAHVPNTTKSSTAAHNHRSQAAPWEGVNLWRTPFKGDTDTVTHVKRNKGLLDRYIDSRVRRIQQLQLLALRNKQTPTWVLLPRDKFFLAAKAAAGIYIVYEISTLIYDNLKADGSLPYIKLLYKDNID